MKKFLSQNRLMPIYGIFIRICYKFKLFAPIVWLTMYFCEPYSNDKPRKKGSITLFALNHTRFRSDLDILSENENFNIVILPHFWMCRLQYAIYRGPVSFDRIFKPDHNDIIQHEKLTEFMALFMPKLHRKMGIDGVISAAVHYISDYVWGSQSSKNGTPYIILHKECFYAAEVMQKYKKDMWSAVPNFVSDLIITHNELMRDIFIEAGITSKGECFALGAMRMDEFLKSYWHKNVPVPEKKQVTFFSFTYRIGVGDGVPHWYDDHDAFKGFARLFEEAHTAFAIFAKNNPDVRCIIKPKWGGIWCDHIRMVTSKNGINIDEISNLEIDENTPAPLLIERSRAVVGYGSTTLLEAAVIGNRDIIIPLLGEAKRPDYKDRVFLRKDLSAFTAVSSQDAFISALENAAHADRIQISDKTQKEREDLFEYWVSPSSANATEKYIEHITKVVQN